MRPRLDELLPIPDAPLPERKGRASRFDLDAVGSAASPLAQALLAQMQAASEGAARELETIARELAQNRHELLARWHADKQLELLLEDVARLPVEAIAGRPRLTGVVPTGRTATAARIYVALLIALATRMLFLGEQRGMDAIATSAEARHGSYRPLLAPESSALILGFPSLHSLLQSAAVSAKAHALANELASSCAPEMRTYIAICMTCELLASCGRARSAA